MAGETASAHLRYTLELRGEKVYKPKSTVLFRRGDKASGMLSFSAEKVSLDLGVDSSLAVAVAQPALVGLPSTITRQNYSTTATVTEDAQLAFGLLKR